MADPGTEKGATLCGGCVLEEERPDTQTGSGDDATQV